VNDSKYMETAICLAKKAKGYTSPNPIVGAVVVKDNQIIGKGWHKKAGLAHAEVEAINDAGEKTLGSDLYVTLEPCNHFGRTPPCTKKIIQAGIKRVVIGAKDPNPSVCGGGIKYLREHGINVESGILKKETETLIEDFIWYVKNKTPFVILKSALTLDGRIATSTGDSKWITNKKSRAYVHKLRHRNDAILVGSGTIKNDNPSLTTRINNCDTKDPQRIILNSKLSIDKNAKVLTQKSDNATIMVVSENISPRKKIYFENTGVQIIQVPEKKGLLDITILMEKLGKMGIMSLLVEGGARIINSFLLTGIINKVMFFIAPKLIGGNDGIPLVRGKGVKLMKDAYNLNQVKTKMFDNDVLVQGYLK